MTFKRIIFKKEEKKCYAKTDTEKLKSQEDISLLKLNFLQSEISVQYVCG